MSNTNSPKTVVKECAMCGKTFVCDNPTAIRVKKYCSPECKWEARKERNHEKAIEASNNPNNIKLKPGPKPGPKPKKTIGSVTKKPAVSVTEICEKAKSLGMTYGQYVAKYMSGN